MMKKQIELESKNLLHNITWLRQHHRLSKKDMAKILGISVNTLNKIEKRELPAHLSVDILFRVHAAFGISPRDQFLLRLGAK